jgi:hypothetical protein
VRHAADGHTITSDKPGSWTIDVGGEGEEASIPALLGRLEASGAVVDRLSVQPPTLGTDAELLEGIWTACHFNSTVRLVDTLGLYQLGQLAEPGAETVA